MTTSRLDQIENFVVIMFENRSFDHILGYLYEDQGNKSPLGHAFDGLTGTESNKDKEGKEIPVQKLSASDPYCYFTPKADPGEGFANTSAQLYQSPMLVTPEGAPNNAGFVTNYQYTLSWEPGAGYHIYPDAGPADIMSMHTPETLPVFSTLAREYAVCDRWFCSVPSETQPNRAFIHMATSEGLIKNNWEHVFSSKSIYKALEDNGQSWSIYSYERKGLSMTRFDIADILHAPESHFGVFSDFKKHAKAGTLSNYVFLEPSWGTSGNSMHPNYDMAKGEAYLKEIYDALVNSPQWEKTLLVITFDEHGGCYDHVAPPANAVSPDGIAANNDFNFNRFGVRVPTILVSPWIKAGTVHRVPSPDDYQPGTGHQPWNEPTPLDHTSILKTVELRFGLDPLTKRDAAAPHLADVFTLDKARTDNVLTGVVPPKPSPLPKQAKPQTAALEKALVKRAGQYPDPDEHDGDRYDEYHFDSSEQALNWAEQRWDRYRCHRHDWKR